MMIDYVFLLFAQFYFSPYFLFCFRKNAPQYMSGENYNGFELVGYDEPSKEWEFVFGKAFWYA